MKQPQFGFQDCVAAHDFIRVPECKAVYLLGMVYTEMAGITSLRSFYLNWPSWVSHQVINCFCAVVAGYAR